jgi:hypothetical protein
MMDGMWTWAPSLGWTLATLLASWLVGHLLGRIAMTRLPRWLPQRQHALVTTAAQIVRRRAPGWSLLIGV